MAKVTVIGAGNLGSCIGFCIALKGVCDQVLFVDIMKDLAEGQKNDVMQSIALVNDTKIRSGDYIDMKGSDVIVLTAGKPRTPDIKSRIELGEINKKIVSGVVDEIIRYSQRSIIITITNPMDLMNYLIYARMRDRKRVIGSGGMLDTARFRTVLSRGKVMDVEAYILGEHGDTQVPIFSRVKIDHKKLDFSEKEKEDIMKKLKLSAINVIGKKGATVYAPALNTAEMVESILKDQKRVMPCSAVLDGEYGIKDVSIGVPCVLGKKGIENIEEWELTKEELEQLKNSANSLKKNILELNI